MIDVDLKTLSDEELIALYKKKYDYWQSWRGNTDGSYMMCYAYDVEPIEKELKHRGLDSVII